ncbi:4-alpha-glucanotransferase, partial [Bacillus safensis]
FAGNPYFIDLELLCKDKLLTKKECESYKWGKKPQYVDYGIMYVNRYALLRKAYERFSKKTPADYEAFCSKEAEWLDEYT